MTQSDEGQGRLGDEQTRLLRPNSDHVWMLPGKLGDEVYDQKEGSYRNEYIDFIEMQLEDSSCQITISKGPWTELEQHSTLWDRITSEEARVL